MPLNQNKTKATLPLIALALIAAAWTAYFAFGHQLIAYVNNNLLPHSSVIKPELIKRHTGMAENALLSYSLLVFLGIIIYLITPRDRSRRVIYVYLAAAASVYLFITYSWHLLNLPYMHYSSDLLAPTFAFAHGYPLYNIDEGPLIPGIYGPLSKLAFLPATLASSPTGAILIAGLITHALFLTPIIWVIISESRRNQVDALSAYAVFLCFCLFILISKPLADILSRIVPDPLAFSLTIFACFLIYRPEDHDKTWRLFLSSFLAAAAIWTKQTTLPLLFSLPLYVAITSGYTHLKRYLACLAISLLALSTPLLLIFNAKAMFFNMVLVPLRHPSLPNNKLYALFLAAAALLEDCRLPMAILTAYLIYQYKTKLFEKHRGIRNWLRSNPWFIYVIVGVCMTPTSLAAKAKEGGVPNSVALVSYFLLLASAIILIQAQSSRPESPRRITKLLVWLIVISSPFWQISSFYYFKKAITGIAHNPQQIAYEYAKAHPGQVYFPNNPLSTIMAEGKAYHTEFGLWDRRTAVGKISRERLYRYLPANMKIVAYTIDGIDHQHASLKKDLADFSRQVTIKELKDYWWVFTKE
jgi:hypothetical protein